MRGFHATSPSLWHPFETVRVCVCVRVLRVTLERESHPTVMHLIPSRSAYLQDRGARPTKQRGTQQGVKGAKTVRGEGAGGGLTQHGVGPTFQTRVR